MKWYGYNNTVISEWDDEASCMITRYWLNRADDKFKLHFGIIFPFDDRQCNIPSNMRSSYE